MSGYRLGHDLDDDPEIYARHVLDECPACEESDSLTEEEIERLDR